MATDQATLDLIRTRLLGWGIQCAPIYPGQDIGQDITFSGGDLSLVKGLENLSQDITIALTTALGADPFNVNFGFDGVNALVEEQTAILTRERVRISVIKLLNSDPRVRRILDVKLLDGRLNPISTDLDATGNPIGLRVLDVKVAFETVTGDQSSLDLGGVKLNG